MNNKVKLSKYIYNVCMEIYNTFAFPTDGTIVKILKYVVVMLACTITSTMLDFYTFISWQGCLICLVFILIFLWIERRQNNALLKMYSYARLSTKKIIQRAKESSVSKRIRRSVAGSRKRNKNAATGKRRNATGKTARRTDGSVHNKKHTGNNVPHRRNEKRNS